MTLDPLPVPAPPPTGVFKLCRVCLAHTDIGTRDRLCPDCRHAIDAEHVGLIPCQSVTDWRLGKPMGPKEGPIVH